MSKPDEPANVLASQLPRLREHLNLAVAEAINQAAGSIRDLREWCDNTEAETEAWLKRHNPECECEVGETRLWAVEQVRALLPPVPESGSPDP